MPSLPNLIVIALAGGAGLYLWTPRLGSNQVSTITANTNQASDSLVSSWSAATSWREFEFKTFWSLIPQIRPPINVTEHHLSEKDHLLLLKGSWIVFVCAEWWPNCENYRQIWDQFVNQLRSHYHHPRQHLNLAMIYTERNPALIAFLNVYKLPSFHLIEEGIQNSSAIRRPTLDDLISVANKDWSKLLGSELQLHSSFVKYWQCRLLNAYYRTSYKVQNLILSWIYRDKIIAYSVILTFVVLAIALKSRGFLKLNVI